MTDHPHRKDPFSHIFRSEGGPKRGRPYRVDKLLNGRWIPMATFTEPTGKEDEGLPHRLAEALGGCVRLQKGEQVLELWYDGVEAQQVRCA